ncbi:hypothetical protein G5B31_08220 [Rhodobacter sp. SGA-6-6]|uniref:hypothetical protein n=1 Tax=Rhodobacter sp. SGA-6-6 TaxID=2710882 RepID=UPI0013EBFFFC|nr:hypothetical protein [Rhodobacter sp. SGA-6-6]NGM45519.1 hypothetical protein [Rhodobacter sp. SGA-6-6]
MPDTTGPARLPVTLINAAALRRMPVPASGGILLVAGSGIVDMTLAELALPGAEMIWTDFRQSSALGRLHQRIDALGGLDRLVLSADGERAEAVFSVMCAILSLLPALRRPGRAQVTLLLDDGPAVASLQEFLQRLAPRLRGDGISVGLEVVLPPAVPAG